MHVLMLDSTPLFLPFSRVLIFAFSESSKAWWDLLKAYETFLKTTHVTTLDVDVSWTTEDRGSPHFGSAIEFWKALAAAPYVINF